MYFNPRKLWSRQMKWIRQYEGPYLILEVPSSVTAKIQRTAKAKPKIIHIDKLKMFEGKTPKSWLSNESEVRTSAEASSCVSLSSDCKGEVVASPDHLSEEQIRSDIRPKRGRKKRVRSSLPNSVESVVVESSPTPADSYWVVDEEILRPHSADSVMKRCSISIFVV